MDRRDGPSRSRRPHLDHAPAVVGHLDWRVQNLGFNRGRVAAIYDWDSVGLVPEAALVGVTSAVHPVDWRLGLPDPLPTLAQVDAFVSDYERARGAPFDDVEPRSSPLRSDGSRAMAPGPSTQTASAACSPTSTTPRAGHASCASCSTGSGEGAQESP